MSIICFPDGLTGERLVYVISCNLVPLSCCLDAGSACESAVLQPSRLGIMFSLVLLLDNHPGNSFL